MSQMTIGLCGWTVDREDCVEGITYAQKLGLGVVQIGFFSNESAEMADVSAIASAANEVEARLLAPFVAFEGEDYSSIQVIHETGGYANDEKYEERVAHTLQVADIAQSLNLDAVAAHIGSIPESTNDSRYEKLRLRVAEVCQELAGVMLLVETGRESARTLLDFIGAVGENNIGVNFDPGNFVVFGTDDPVRAVSTLKGCIGNVHMKDAKASDAPGRSYGSPAACGRGDANIPRVLNKLRTGGYNGPILIEENTRALGVESLSIAADYLRSMLM